MTDDDSKLTRRRVLGGLITVGAASAAAGAGTFALFNDSETSEGNQLSAGTLTLDYGGSGLSFNPGPLKPTDSGSASADLVAGGNITGDLSVEVTDFTAQNGSGTDNLEDQLELRFEIEDSGGTVTTLTPGGTSSGSGSSSIANQYSGSNWDDVITGLNSAIFTVYWNFPNHAGDSSIDNDDAQGDSITIDFEFTLDQQTSS